MAKRRTILALVISYLLGIAGSWSYYINTRPSDEQRFHMQIDDAIQNDLCNRINADLKNFEQSPHTFKRTSLKVLINESTAVANTLFQNTDDGQTIKFRGSKSGSIVAGCLKVARRWVEIRSVFPELYDAELAMMNESIRPEALSHDSKKKSVPVTTQGKRLALVIGNSNYENRPLKNPTNDAKDLGEALKGAGFRVIELYDADLKGMRNTIKLFADQLKDYDVGLVYYSGHGIEFAGRNYLIPVNADIKTEEEIPRQAFDATEIIEKMNKNNVKTSIFILDACRNAPVFSSFKSVKTGLAIMQGSSGSIVAFSAAPGQVALDGNGRNSPYTSVLLKQIQIPNKKIEDVVKDTARLVSENTQGRQIPWYNSSLVGDFYFIEKQ